MAFSAASCRAMPHPSTLRTAPLRTMARRCHRSTTSLPRSCSFVPCHQRRHTLGRRWESYHASLHFETSGQKNNLRYRLGGQTGSVAGNDYSAIRWSSFSSLTEVGKLAAMGVDAAEEIDPERIYNPLPDGPKNDDQDDEDGGAGFEEVQSKDSNDKLDARARAKLLLLAEAKRAVNRTCTLLKSASAGDKEHLLGQLRDQHEALARAYAQAIRYVSRNTKNKESASSAEALLHEMLSRTGASLRVGGSRRASFDPLLSMARGDRPPDRLAGLSSTFPVPDIRTFHHVLHAWASSKARRKGAQAEGILKRMAELCLWYPDEFGGVRPDSKAFALVIKCLAGTTHKDSLPRIIQLHKIYDLMAKHGESHPGAAANDPFVLMHSLKALKNYRIPEQEALAQLWLGRLHSYVMELAIPMVNGSVCGSVDARSDAENARSDVVINLTSTYTSVIREYSKARLKDSHLKARAVLDQMKELQSVCREGALEGVAHMEVRTNAYDLVISCYRNARKKASALEALRLLDEMIDARKNREVEEMDKDLSARSSLHVQGEVAAESSIEDVDVESCSRSSYSNGGMIPYPSETSFALTMQTLSAILLEEHYSESKRLLDEVEHLYELEGVDSILAPSTMVYNSLLNLYVQWFAHEPNLLDRVRETLKRMEVMAHIRPNVRPDATTWSHVLRACSLSHEMHMEEALELANETFESLVKNDEQQEGMMMTDQCYFYMMKCIMKLDHDATRKEDKVKDLFHSAAKKGLVNANVLNALKSTVSDTDFRNIVGDGRLADHWVANVTSVKALYTDGTMGGPGKNARRKGKSTSGWERKQKEREEKRSVRKADKRIKKLKVST